MDMKNTLYLCNTFYIFEDWYHIFPQSSHCWTKEMNSFNLTSCVTFSIPLKISSTVVSLLERNHKVSLLFVLMLLLIGCFLVKPHYLLFITTGLWDNLIWRGSQEVPSPFLCRNQGQLWVQIRLDPVGFWKPARAETSQALGQPVPWLDWHMKMFSLKSSLNLSFNLCLLSVTLSPYSNLGKSGSIFLITSSWLLCRCLGILIITVVVVTIVIIITCKKANNYISWILEFWILPFLHLYAWPFLSYLTYMFLI